MPDNKNENLTNDFNVARQASTMQKQQTEDAKRLLDPKRQQQEMKRQSEVDKIKDDKARQDIVLELVERDKTLADNLERLKTDQTTKTNNEINKEINKQGNPVLDMVGAGRSPQAAAEKVRARMLPEQKKEQEGYVRGSFDVANHSIDKKIQQTIEREQTQEQNLQHQIENRPPDQVFEKPAGEKTAKDAFAQAHDRTGGETDWRSLAADRQQGDRER
jgi:uncharacterized protein YjgD (DUF1641 family)